MEFSSDSTVPVGAPGSKSRVVETARDGVQQGIESLRVVDLLHGKRPDFLAREEAKVDTADGRGNWLGDIHGCQTTHRCWPLIVDWEEECELLLYRADNFFSRPRQDSFRDVGCRCTRLSGLRRRSHAATQGPAHSLTSTASELEASLHVQNAAETSLILPTLHLLRTILRKGNLLC